jgi:hypothetical protein
MNFSPGGTADDHHLVRTLRRARTSSFDPNLTVEVWPRQTRPREISTGPIDRCSRDFRSLDLLVVDFGEHRAPRPRPLKCFQQWLRFGDTLAKPLPCAKSELQDALLDEDSWRKLYLRCLLDERAQPTRLYPLLAVAAVPLVTCVSINAAAGGEHTNVFVNCFCSDVVGGELCTALKQKVGALSGFRLADQPFRAGVGVHLACRAAGSEVKEAQSAVSVTYTVYLDSPNEVFVALAVMLVGLIVSSRRRPR